MRNPTADTAPRHPSSAPGVRVYVRDGRPVLALGGLSRILTADQARTLAQALTAAADGADAAESIPRTRLRPEVHPTAAGFIRVRIGAAALDLYDDQAFRFADRIADAAEAVRPVLAAEGPAA